MTIATWIRFSLLCITIGLSGSLDVFAEKPIEFNRDIRPILSDKCFRCHGPDANTREADLRFDTEEGAKADLGGYAAIVPGNAKESELVARIAAEIPARRMPPRKAEKQLTPREIDLLRRWVEQGAKWQRHWAFLPPQRPTPPKSEWGHNAIDAFVGDRLQREGLQPSPEADREALIRRASLTLTGLPPTLDEIDAFLADTSPNAYEKVLDRLLKSERYGERMAWFWLDAARYADTDGYQVDSERTMWPWRDWVIKAFNDNMPFDRFTIEQLAGDMVPEATPMQRLASGFNRNHRLNAEAGALAEEFIVEYAIDRVETTSIVWLGLTVGCARCHDHKFDPISQKEFYSLYAYFNSISERGTGKGTSAPPTIKIGSPLIRPSKELREQLASKRNALRQSIANIGHRQQAWEKSQGRQLTEQPPVWSQPIGGTARTEKGGSLTHEPDDSFKYSGKNQANDHYVIDIPVSPGQMKRVTALRLDVLRDPTFTKPYGFARSVNGNFVLTSLTLSELGEKPRPIALQNAKATYSQPNYSIAHVLDGKPKTGWAIANHPDNPNAISAMVELKQPLMLTKETRLRLRLEHASQFRNHNIGRVRIALSDRTQPALEAEVSLSPELLAAVAVKPSERTKRQRDVVREYYLGIDPETAKLRREIRDLEQRIAGDGPQATVMVMQEMPNPKPTYLLERGQYDSPDKSEVLPRKLPTSITQAKPPKNRLELAKWLVSKDNPLTARVIVNRIWQQHFGQGLVKTTEDFGSQGDWPSHPELLDWLAVEFQSDWDIKRLHKLILLSATYRQASKTTPELQQRDPSNRLLARGPRFRLDGAAIRDQALFVSGLFNNKMGGPPVKPYQPEGLWSVVNSRPTFRYTPSKGADLYRRSLYTYWKRAVAPPRLLIFDAAGREACNVRSRVTNTPLQALALMNDPTFIEAARALAERMMKHDSTDVDRRLAYGYRVVIGRQATAKQMQVLRGNLDFFRSYFEKNPAQAKEFLAVGESMRDASLKVDEHAAYSATAHLMLNLDETITLE